MLHCRCYMLYVYTCTLYMGYIVLASPSLPFALSNSYTVNCALMNIEHVIWRAGICSIRILYILKKKTKSLRVLFWTDESIKTKTVINLCSVDLSNIPHFSLFSSIFHSMCFGFDESTFFIVRWKFKSLINDTSNEHNFRLE